MKIVGLTGAAGAGKDTVAQLAIDWCRENSITAERLAFADLLKVSAAACFGIPPHVALEFCNWLKQPGVFVTAERLEGEGDLPVSVSEVGGVSGKAVTGRQFLQFYGTEAHRNVFGVDFWEKGMEDKLNLRAGNVDVVFITDPRFDNEAKLITAHDGEIWEIVRPSTESIEAHSSEAGLSEGYIEFRLHNDGSLEDLKTLVESACECNLVRSAV